MTNISYGPKYERGMDITEVAKRVREDLKVATKAGEFPKGTKFSVKTDRFSGGRSCDLRIKELPGVEIFRRMEEHEKRYPDDKYVVTEEVTRYLGRASAILNAYNYDGSDISTDYFNVSFYGHAELDNELYTKSKAVLEAADGDVDARVALMAEEAGLKNLPLWKFSANDKEELMVWLDAKIAGNEYAPPAKLAAVFADRERSAKRKEAEKALRAERKAIRAARSAA